MTEQGLKYLSDIAQAIELIEEFLSPISGYTDFLKDKKTQSAIERQLSIIGEAINKYDLLQLEEKIDNSRKIVGFRNRLIHAYDAIDTTMIWAIIKNHLPLLKTEISAFLK
jgi:uncharacterized protein with HEPN domain